MLLLGLFEGPAEIACIFALVTFLAARRLQGTTLGPIELGLLVWLAAGTVGVLGSEARVSSETLTRPLLVLAYILGRGSITGLDEPWTGRLAWAFGGALVVNGAYGLFQVFVFDPPLESLIIGRVKHQNLVDPEHGLRLKMATGLFYNRLKLAHLGVVGLALFAVLLSAPTRARRWAAVLAVVLAAAIFFTYRRAAPLALIASLAGFGLLFAGQARRRWLLGSGALASVVLLGLIFTREGRVRLRDAGAALYERQEIHGHALELWSRTPWFGAGHGHYRALIGTVTDRLSPLLETSAHGWFLETLVETGVIGALGFLTALGVALFRLTKRLLESRGQRGTVPILRDRFVWIALVALIVLGLAHSVLYHRPVALAFWTLLGLAAGPPGDIRKTRLSNAGEIATGAKSEP